MKIGIFGGSFNPPHNMHKNIVVNLIKNGHLDKVIYVPVGDKYKKDCLLSYYHRLNMLKLMVKNIKNVNVSNIGNNENYEYTYQVLDYYKKKYKNADIYFICGMDNLEVIDTWKNYEYILKNYKLLVINRNKDTHKLLHKYNDYKENIIIANIKEDNISSSYIRANINNKDIKKYIDKNVFNYIKENNLYFKPNIKRIKLYTNDKTKDLEETKIIKDKLINNGFEIVDGNYDLIIALGGDGTFLKTINDTKFNSNTYYVGINLGTLGFSQDINMNNIDEFIYELKNKKFNIENISIGEAIVYSKNKKYKLNYMNEIVIRKGNLRVIRTDININNNFLENYVGDALLISTPFGSTAEGMCFNGGVMYNMDALEITPIGPINSSKYKTIKNSIIVPNYEITLGFNEDNLYIIKDGNLKKYNNVIKIVTKVSDKKIKLLRLSSYNFESKLRDKMLK